MIVDTARIFECIQEFGHPEMNHRYTNKSYLLYVNENQAYPHTIDFIE